MNSRLDHDQDNAVITQIKSLEADVNELKSRQSIGRELVTRTYSVQTANTVDVSNFSVAPGATGRIYFYFTGDGSQPYPFGVQCSQVYNGPMDSAHRLSDYEINDANGVNYSWTFNTAYRNVNSISWVISINNVGSATASINIKFKAIVSCPATALSYQTV